MLAKRFSVVEFFGDAIISTPVSTYDEGFQIFCDKFYNGTLLDEFIIIDEMTGDVVFTGSEVFAR